MKYLNKKFLNEMSSAIKETNHRNTQIQLDYLSKIKTNNKFKYIINWSRYTGKILNQALGSIPKEILQENIGYELYQRKENETIFAQQVMNHGEEGNAHLNHNSDTYRKTLRENIFLGKGHNEFYITFPTLCTGYDTATKANSILDKNGLLNEMTEKNFHNIGWIAHWNKPIYLKKLLDTNQINIPSFIEEISQNLIDLAKQGRSNQGLLEDTLIKLKIIPDEWMFDEIK